MIGGLKQEDQTLSIDKTEREVAIIDIAIPGDDRVKDKEYEKIEKYRLLKDEVAVSVNFGEYMKRIGVNVRLEVLQKTALLGK